MPGGGRNRAKVPEQRCIIVMLQRVRDDGAWGGAAFPLSVVQRRGEGALAVGHAQLTAAPPRSGRVPGPADNAVPAIFLPDVPHHASG